MIVQTRKAAALDASTSLSYCRRYPDSHCRAIGIYVSLHTFRTEMLGYLQPKVEVRAQSVGRSLDPFAAELLFLARTSLT